MKQVLFKKIFRIVIILGLLITPGMMEAQSSGSQVSTGPPSSRASKRAAKKQWKQDRKKKHDKDKSLRSYQKRTQTKSTRKRMRASRHTAELNNEHKREFFVKRWFKHKGRIHKKKKKDR
ncbi:MAG: hypothetical protein ACHQRM_15185 [Bacteroidia bacterium]